jgi:hypothetical protein
VLFGSTVDSSEVDRKLVEIERMLLLITDMRATRKAGAFTADQGPPFVAQPAYRSPCRCIRAGILSIMDAPNARPPMNELAEKTEESIERAKDSRLNNLVAVFVVVSATFMALCNLKDGNVVQAMQQIQAKAVDLWAYYQAKGTKQHIAENTVDLLQAQLETAGGLTPEQRAAMATRVSEQRARVKTYEKEKEQIKADAEQAAKDYDALNVHDDQFDLSEACSSVAIALAGVTALTKKPWLLGVASVFAGIGLVFGLAGFLHWQLHSDLMAKLLG